MKGLLVKDFALLKNQKQYFASILIIALIFAVTGQNLYFVISYCTLITAFFSLSTIGYDEYNNGLFYLFTMPVSRKGYAVEKYLFALLVGGVTWIFTTLAAGIYTWVQAPGTNMVEWLIGAAAEFLALEAMVMLLLPVQLKFGAEKGRIAGMIISFGMFGVVMIIAKIAKAVNLQPNLGWVSEISPALGCVIGFAAFAAVMLISMAVSIRIMEHKKF